MPNPRAQFTMGSAMIAIAILAIGLSLPGPVLEMIFGVASVGLVVVALSLGIAWFGCLLERPIDRITGDEAGEDDECPPI